MSRRRWIGLAILAVAVAGMVVAGIAVTTGSGFETRSVALPTLVPSGANIPGGEIELRADGVGPATFGQPLDEVIDEFTSRIGPLGEDSVQPCPAGDQRWLGWGSLSILGRDDRFVGFVTGIYFPPIGPELNVRTSDGLRLRMSEEQLREIYGDRLTIRALEPPADAEVAEFGVDGYLPSAGGAPEGIGGYLEAGATATIVIAINGGNVLC